MKSHKENPAGCAREGKESKENRKREKAGLKITDNSIM